MSYRPITTTCPFVVGTSYSKYVFDIPSAKETPAGTIGSVPLIGFSNTFFNAPLTSFAPLIFTSHGKIVGYTVGNDMSSRSIEGENPLYLPQAKSYDGAAAIGPCLFVPETVINPNAQISLSIKRANEEVFVGTISINQMKRQHTELVAYLFRECTFPQGCYLMTGTGIVPPNEFTLAPGDEIAITIEHIGTLRNWVD